MTTPYLSPPVFSWPAAPGGKLHTYLAGGVVAQATYSDAAGVTPNTNPVTLDSLGSAVVRLAVGVAYHFTLKDSSDTTTLWDADNYDNNYLSTGSGVGAVLYPRTVAEIAAAVTPSDYTFAPYDLRRYGADPTGVATSDTAMTAAIAVCGANGGTIRAPNGTYDFANPIALNSKRSIIIQGDAGETSGGAASTIFRYRATGTGTWINCNSALGVGFRNIQFYHTSASFTGTYFTFNHDGGGGQDSGFCFHSDCTFGSSLNGVGTTHLNLDKCIIYSATRCTFSYGNPAIQGQATAGGSYSNSINFSECTFQANYSTPIKEAGQNWNFFGCTIENLVSGAIAFISSTGSAAQINGLSIIGCWFGDGVGTPGVWLDLWGGGLAMVGNYMAGAASTVCIRLHSWYGAQITGNGFVSFPTFMDFATATCKGIVVQGNNFNSVTTAYTNAANVEAAMVFGPNGGLASPIPAGHGAFNANGYAIDPATGIIRQWGSLTLNTNVSTPVLFNVNGINFPAACFGVVATITVSPGNNAIQVTAQSTTGFSIQVSGTVGSNTLFWEAIGN